MRIIVKRVFAPIILMIAMIVAVIGLTGAGAAAAEVTFGCNVQLALANGLSPSTQAPGQSGNGPLTILSNGTIIVPPAFAGGVGC